jgi:hypothetical protein
VGAIGAKCEVPSNQLHNSLTEEERAELKAAESQLYDDAGLPSSCGQSTESTCLSGLAKSE